MPFDLTPDDDGPSPEDERHYWSGPGYIEFYVLTNRPEHGLFEFDVEDYDGCAGGAFESVGEDYLITEMLDIDVSTLREGWTYRVENLTVVHTRGDGWMTDDDSTYYHDGLTARREWGRWFRQKIENAWWFSIGWRLAEWGREA